MEHKSMDNDSKERERDAHDVHDELASIEAESDMLARKNETPQEVVATKQAADEYQAKAIKEKIRELASRKRRSLKPNKWVLVGIAVALVVLAATWFIPVTRYAVLNTLGMRDSIKVVSSQASSDGSTVQSQIKNFTAEVAGQKYLSGDATEITIPSLEYGKHVVAVSKEGYASATYETVVDFDPFFGLFTKKEKNPIAAELIAQGLPVTFTVKDWTSRQSLSKGSFTFGDITAQPDEKGKVTLIIPPTAEKTVAVKAEFSEDYLGKSFEVEVNKSDQEVLFVPSAKHYFVSKRSGVYSIYSSYLDSSDIKEIVAGTNQETSSLQFAVSPSGKYGVMSSTREGRRDRNGDLMQKLYWVDLSSGKLEDLDVARYIYLHDWSGDTITYSYSYQDEEANDYRQRLRSLDAATLNRYDLSSTTGGFGRVHVSVGMVLFTKQEGYNKPGFEKGNTLHTVGLKGEDSRELATNIGELRQLGFERFAYETVDKKWNEISINTGEIKSTEPPREQGAVYISTQSAKNERVFINFVDGKRILMLRHDGDQEKELVSQPGLVGPVRFISATTIVYRVATPTETADYAVSTLGGEPRKVTDVTSSSYATPVFFQYY